MATKAQIDAFINRIGETVAKVAAQYGQKFAGVVIAQFCYESGYGTSSRAVNQHNLGGDIVTGKDYKTDENFIKSYFSWDSVNNNDTKSAKSAKEYIEALGKHNYYVASDNVNNSYVTNVMSIYNTNNLKRFDGYNPDKCKEFVDIVIGYKGLTAAKWKKKFPKRYNKDGWSAYFIWACAEQAKIANVIGGIAGSSAVSTMAHKSVDTYKCTSHAAGGKYKPKKGDLVFFASSKPTKAGATVTANKVGCVIEDAKMDVSFICSDLGTKDTSIKKHKYAVSDSRLVQYISPNWNLLNKSETPTGGDGESGSMPTTLYEYLNTPEDAILREIAYMKTSNYKLVKESQRIRVSMINYTALQESLYEAAITLGIFGDVLGDSDYSALDTKVQTVIKHLVGKGVNNAVACGIAGNIFYESNFNTASIGDNGTSFGICQWHNERATSMKNYVGSNWSNNLTGQLDFLWKELSEGYSGLVADYKAYANTESSAKLAADRFCREFERPADPSGQSAKRQAKAAEYFKLIKTLAKANTSFGSSNDKNLTGSRKDFVARAKAELGKPYVWGAVGPDGYDCSGLVSYAILGKHERLGTTSTFMQYKQTNSPKAGDICTSSSHCGLYIGDGKMVHAPTTGDVVKIAAVQSGMIYVLPPSQYL